jgi:hypothetical protein
LCEIDGALLEVEREWPRIDVELQRMKSGRKDPFTSVLRNNMLSAYAYLDELLAKGIAPFSSVCFDHMVVLNNRVHYGTDTALMAEFASAIEVNLEKFNAHIDPIAAWYWKHTGQGDQRPSGPGQWQQPRQRECQRRT